MTRVKAMTEVWCHKDLSYSSFLLLVDQQCIRLGKNPMRSLLSLFSKSTLLSPETFKNLFQLNEDE